MQTGVIVPVRAPAPWLAAALDSLLAQDPPPDRVVVVDDGSAPAVRLAERHAGPVQLVRREASGGPAAARQAGLEAIGDVDLVGLCDADDVWRPGKLAAQLAALERHPEAAACVGRARIVGPDGAETGEAWETLSPGVHEPAALLPVVYERNPLAISSVVVWAAALRDAGGFATAVPAISQDADLWLRLLARGERFVSEPAAEVLYRRHPGGLTADVAALAEAQLALHEAHGGLVAPEVRRRAEATDLRALARGRAGQGRHAEARAALARAAALTKPSASDRAYALALGVPGLRRALGRRAPYRA